MATDLASLGFAVDSSSIEAASKSLDKMTTSGKNAQVSADVLIASAVRLGISVQEVERRLAAANDDLKANADMSMKLADATKMASAANDNFSNSIKSSNDATKEANRGFVGALENVLTLVGHLKLLAAAAYALSPAFRGIVNAGISKILSDIIPVSSILTRTVSSVGTAASSMISFLARMTPLALAAVVTFELLNTTWHKGVELLEKYKNAYRALYSDDVSGNLEKLSKGQNDIINASQVARATELATRLSDAQFTIDKMLEVTFNWTDAALKLQSVWVSIKEIVASTLTYLNTSSNVTEKWLQKIGSLSIWDKISGRDASAAMPDFSFPGEGEDKNSPINAATNKLSAMMGVANLASEALNKAKMASGEFNQELDIGSSFVARYSDNIKKLAEGVKDFDTWDRVAKNIERHTRAMEANAASAEKSVQFQEQLRVETQLLASTRNGLNAATDDQIDSFVKLRTEGVDPLNAAVQAGIKFDKERAKSFEEISKAAGEARLSLVQANAAIAHTKALETDQIALRGLTAFSPSQKGEIASQQKLLELKSQIGKEGLTQEQADERAASARKLAYQSEVVQLNEVARARLLSAKQNVDSAKLEIDLIGKTIGQQTELRANLAARQQLEQEASQKRTAFDEAQYERLKKVNEELGKQAQLNAIASVNDNIRFDRKTALLTPEDVAIAQQLRQIYPDVATALNSVEASAIQTNKALSSISGNISNTLVTGLTDIADGTKSVSQGFGDMSKSIARAVEEMVIKLYIVIPLMRTLQSLVSSLGFGGGMSPAESVASGTAPVMHSGGIVGQDATAMRSVDSNIFKFAPRFHRGLAPDEFPAILQRGEGVFTRNQMAAMGGKGSPNVTVNLIEDSTRAGQTESNQNLKGGTDITVYVDAITAKNASNPGSATSAALDTRKRMASR